MGRVRSDLDRCGRQHRITGRDHRQLTGDAPADGSRHEQGSGLIGTAGGLLVFLLLMFAAVQVLFDLYATSMVTSAAHDAARVVAGFDSAGDRCRATAQGDRAFSNRLGSYATEAGPRLTWTCTDPDVVRVRVTADHPTILPPLVAGLTGLGQVDRTIEIRVESVR